jgi:hypothetical protein
VIARSLLQSASVFSRNHARVSLHSRPRPQLAIWIERSHWSIFEFLARDFPKTSYTGYIARSILSSLPYYLLYDTCSGLWVVTLLKSSIAVLKDDQEQIYSLKILWLSGVWTIAGPRLPLCLAARYIEDWKRIILFQPKILIHCQLLHLMTSSLQLSATIQRWRNNDARPLTQGRIENQAARSPWFDTQNWWWEYSAEKILYYTKACVFYWMP